MTNLIFDSKTITGLISAYNKATKDGKPSFHFQDAHLVTAYAKYLLEYVTNEKHITGIFGRDKCFIQVGNRINVYKNDWLWHPSAKVLDIENGHAVIFSQGQDENIQVKADQIALAETVSLN